MNNLVILLLTYPQTCVYHNNEKTYRQVTVIPETKCNTYLKLSIALESKQQQNQIIKDPKILLVGSIQHFKFQSYPPG